MLGDKDMEGESSEKLIEEISRKIQSKKMSKGTLLDAHRDSTPGEED